MADGINNIGQTGLSYVDQLKQLQDKNKPDETTGKQDLKQEDFLSLLTKFSSEWRRYFFPFPKDPKIPLILFLNGEVLPSVSLASSYAELFLLVLSSDESMSPS